MVLIMNIVNCKYVFTVKDTWNTIVRGNYSKVSVNFKNNVKLVFLIQFILRSVLNLYKIRRMCTYIILESRNVV